MSDHTPAGVTRATCRSYLAGTVDPGRTPNTVAQLVKVMPPWFADEITRNAPALAKHVTRIAKRRAALARAEAAVTHAEAAFTQALGAWIDDKPIPARPAPDSPRETRRGDCSVCGQDYALTLDGLIRRHNGMTRAGFSTGERCDGTRRPPAPRPGAERDRAVNANTVGTCDGCRREEQPLTEMVPGTAWLCVDRAACMAAGGGAA